jgi:hypothetical protein
MRQGSKFVQRENVPPNFLAASGMTRKLVNFIPEGVGQIHNDRFRSAADLLDVLRAIAMPELVQAINSARPLDIGVLWYEQSKRVINAAWD